MLKIQPEVKTTAQHKTTHNLKEGENGKCLYAILTRGAEISNAERANYIHLLKKRAEISNAERANYIHILKKQLNVLYFN